MKKQTTNQFSPISKEQTEQLTTVVKETLALGISHVKTFSTADLWNIQRRGRTMMSRRNYFA
jgi:methionine aminopeptidase